MSYEIENGNVDTVTDKTVFLLLAFNRFGNTKAVNVQVAKRDANGNLVETDADVSRFKHNKKLLDAVELKAIEKADGAIRQLVDSFCIPYMEGVRLIPWLNVPKLRPLLKEYFTVTRPALVDKAASVYENLVKQAQIDLKEHFNPLDYPGVEAFKKSYQAIYQFKTFQTPEKLEQLDPEFFEDEQAKAAELYSSAVNEFVANLRQSAYELTSELLDKLSDNADGKKKKLHNSRIEALKEFIAGFTALNVAGDKQLAGEIAKLNMLVDGVDADKIKHNDGFKIEFTQKLAELKGSLGSLVEVKGRKFRD